MIPDPKEVVGEISLDCTFKDVTYEMLRDKLFQEKIRKAYPYVPWPEPFEEIDAAPEKGDDL